MSFQPQEYSKMALKQIKVNPLVYGPVSVWYDRELAEYQVQVKGSPEATYYTSDRTDALATAQVMRKRLPLGDAE